MGFSGPKGLRHEEELREAPGGSGSILSTVRLGGCLERSRMGLPDKVFGQIVQTASLNPSISRLQYSLSPTVRPDTLSGQSVRFPAKILGQIFVAAEENSHYPGKHIG